MSANAIKKYLIFMKAGAQTVIAYRGQIFLWFFGGLLNAVLMGLLWWAVFQFSEGDSIAGYTFPQMLLYVILAAVVGEVTYSATMGEITDDVRYGLIGMRLMKPVNYRWQLGFSMIGAFAVRFLILGIPFTVIGSLIAVFGFGLTGLVWYNILLFIPACFLAMLLVDTVEFIFGQLAFRTQAMFGVSSMSSVLIGFLSGSYIPIALFPDWAQNILYYTPFPSIMSTPVRLFLGQMDGIEILTAFGISIGWIIVLNIAAQLLYKSSVRHVVVFGG